jgi:peptide deformylase
MGMRLPLLLYPNKDLTLLSDEVGIEWARSEEFRDLIVNLKQTLVNSLGVGLSAIQAGVQDRVFVMYASGLVRAFVNPVIVETDGELEGMDEACLSAPGVVERVQRFPEVTIEAGVWPLVTREIPRSDTDRFVRNRKSTLMDDDHGAVLKEVTYLGHDAKVKVTYEDLHQEIERKRFQLAGVESQCAQHEIDHLDGIMKITDGAGPVKRDIIKRKIKKALRHH